MPEPLVRFVSGAQALFTRSGWGVDDCLVTFGPMITWGSHGDRAAGGFLMFRGDWVAAKAGLATASGLDQAAADSNVLTVDGLEQFFGQQTAAITHWEDTDTYTYAVADLFPAYQGQLLACGRELFFLRPNTLLVWDHFITTKASSLVTWNLNTLVQPILLGPNFQAGRLWGSIVSGAGSVAAVDAVRQTPAQPPTYRLRLPATSPLLVALEAGAAGQAQSSLGSPIITAGLIGIPCGGRFVAWLNGTGPWTYRSSGAFMHYLLGLQPNTVYQGPGGPITSSAVGVLSFIGNAAGQPVTISGGNIPPPTMNIDGYRNAKRDWVQQGVSGDLILIEGSGFPIGEKPVVNLQGLLLPVNVWSQIEISTTLPSTPQRVTGPIVVTSGGVSAAGPVFALLPGNPPPPPPPTVSGYAPNPVDAGQSLTISGTNFTSDAMAACMGVDMKAVFVSSTQLLATAPSFGNASVSASVIISQASGQVTGPKLTITPAPPPPMKQFTISGTAVAQPDGSLTGTIALVPKP